MKQLCGKRTRPSERSRRWIIGCVLALVLGTSGAARAQYMSCESFLALEAPQRYVYITGFVEGVTYTQLDLAQRAKVQSERTDLKDEEKRAIGIMSRVADNIALSIPEGLTVQQVTDKLIELCGPDGNKKSAFVNIYSQYSLGLRQAAIMRLQQQPAPGDAPQQPPAAPAPGGAKPKAKAPAPQPAAAPSQTGAAPAAQPPTAAKPAQPVGSAQPAAPPAAAKPPEQRPAEAKPAAEPKPPAGQQPPPKP